MVVAVPRLRDGAFLGWPGYATRACVVRVATTDGFAIDSVADEQLADEFAIVRGIFQVKNSECGLHRTPWVKIFTRFGFVKPPRETFAVGY